VHAAPDGYTLLAMTITNTVNATLYRDLAFEITRDIAPIVATFKSPLVMVVSLSFAAKTVPELIADAKAHPGKINYASFGNGSVALLVVGAEDLERAFALGRLGDRRAGESNYGGMRHRRHHVGAEVLGDRAVRLVDENVDIVPRVGVLIDAQRCYANAQGMLLKGDEGGAKFGRGAEWGGPRYP
jgi:hypothetical protein